MRGTSILIILGLGLSQAGGQTVINGGRRIKGAWDASGALSTKPVKTGTALPATCSVGEEFFKTDAPAGQNQYGCTSTNTWTPLGAGSTITNLNQIPTRSYADLQNVPATFPPAAHKATHAMGGSDALAPADIGAESTAMKGTPNGYAALDANGLVPAAQLPAAQLGGTAVFAPVLSSNTFGAAAVANKLVCGGIVAPVQVVFSAITYGVQTADATGRYGYAEMLHRLARSSVHRDHPHRELLAGRHDHAQSGPALRVPDRHGEHGQNVCIHLSHVLRLERFVRDHHGRRPPGQFHNSGGCLVGGEQRLGIPAPLGTAYHESTCSLAAFSSDPSGRDQQSPRGGHHRHAGDSLLDRSGRECLRGGPSEHGTGDRQSLLCDRRRSGGDRHPGKPRPDRGAGSLSVRFPMGWLADRGHGGGCQHIHVCKPVRGHRHRQPSPPGG